MVTGLDLFREAFAPHHRSFVLIGGAACHLAMSAIGSEFRVTHDLDIVLCLEELEPAFVQRLWRFIKEGGYAAREKSRGGRFVYRFHKPSDQRFPAMLEFFSRRPTVIELAAESHLTPVPVGDDVSSLSAILLDDDYYALIQDGRRLHDGLPHVAPEYLIPLKARAWLDLSARRNAGHDVDASSIRKHRNDCLRLAAIVPGRATVALPPAIRADLQRFRDDLAGAELPLRQLGLGTISTADIVAILQRVYALP